jgi:hypothetical protein
MLPLDLGTPVAVEADEISASVTELSRLASAKMALPALLRLPGRHRKFYFDLGAHGPF